MESLNVLCTVGRAADLVRDIDMADARECLSILVIDVKPASSIFETVADSLFVSGGSRSTQKVPHSATTPC